MGENCCTIKGSDKNGCSEEEMKKKCMKKGIGLLLIRLSLAFFILHGWMKVTDIAATAGFFAQLGIPMPELMAWVAGLAQLIGGLAILLGVCTSIFGVLVAFTMLVAFVTAGVQVGFPANEIIIVFFLVALGIAFTGPGKYSLKAIAKEKCPCGGNCPICKF